MGSRGPAPKSNPVRRNKHEYATQLSKESQKGRPLPKYLPITTAAAKHYWKMWSESPQTAEWLETDWEFLAQTTLLVDSYYKEPKPSTAGEIRQREGKLGGTVEDRARLRMTFEKPKDEEASAQEAAERLVSDTEDFLKAFGGN